MAGKRCLAVTAVIASTIASPAFAQAPAVPQAAAAPGSQPDHPEAGERLDIVVTANKQSELQRNVANSVTAITGADLDQRRLVRLQDLTAEVPGLSLEAADKTAVRIVLRGLNTGSVGATVASVLDDVPINATGAQTNADFNSPNFDTYDLDRVEVLRGPQSTLYGATAEGGLIKYVTNAPKLDTFAGEVETGLDGTTVGGVGGSLKGFINVPLIDDVAALRVTAWNEWFPGYVDDPEIGKTNTNAARQYGWRASLLVTPVTDLTIRLTAERQSLLSDNADDVQAVGAALTPMTPPANQFSLFNGLRNNSALRSPSQNESGVYYASVNYDLQFANLTSITSYTYNNFKTFLDASNINIGAGLTYSQFFQENVYGQPLLVDERQNSNGDKFNEEVRLASDPGAGLFDGALDWLGGFYYTHETTAFMQSLDALGIDSLGVGRQPLAPAAGGIDLYGNLVEWAAFGQVDYHITPTIDVALGGRLGGNDQHSEANYLCCISYGPSAPAGEVRSNDHDALFSVAPRWRPSDETTVYARIASGYRPGGPNLPIPAAPTAPKSYGSDRTTNYELGWRQEWLDKSVSTEITGFWVTWRDVQILSIVNTPVGPVSVDGNSGAAETKGVEWNLTWLPLPGLTLNAVGDYVDARLTADAPGLGAAKGNFLPYVPDVSASVNVDYRWDLTDGVAAYVSGTWSHTGERYTGFSPSTTVLVSHALLPSYDTGALRAGIDTGRYRLEAYVNNVGDARGIATYGNSGGAGQTGQIVLIQPRTIGLLAAVSF